MKPLQKTLLFGGSTTTPLTADVVSDSLKVEQTYAWNISPSTTDLTGAPTYTVEVSNNDVDWYSYDDLFTDIALTKAVESEAISFLYVRVAITSNGATGSAEFNATFKLT